VGFGPVTSSLPIIADEDEDEDDGANEFSSKSFGFFGAVTSAISIVPQVNPGGSEGQARPPRA